MHFERQPYYHVDDYDDSDFDGDDYDDGDDGGGFEMLQAWGVSLALWRLVIPIQTAALEPA